MTFYKAETIIALLSKQQRVRMQLVIDEPVTDRLERKKDARKLQTFVG